MQHLHPLPVPVLALALALLLAAAPGRGQPLQAPDTRPAVTVAGGQKPALTARLVDKDQKAAKRAATVQVEPRNVTLTDPAAAGERPQPGQAHLHYRVDSGPVVATTTTKLSFHELEPGAHRISVVLAGNDHQPVSDPVQLEVRVPGGPD